MKIPIGDNFILTTDERNYTVQEKVVSKGLTKTWRVIGYFTELKHAVNFITELQIKKIDAVEIKAVLKEMNKIKFFSASTRHIITTIKEMK